MTRRWFLVAVATLAVLPLHSSVATGATRANKKIESFLGTWTYSCHPSEPRWDQHDKKVTIWKNGKKFFLTNYYSSGKRMSDVPVRIVKQKGVTFILTPEYQCGMAQFRHAFVYDPKTDTFTAQYVMGNYVTAMQRE